MDAAAGRRRARQLQEVCARRVTRRVACSAAPRRAAVQGLAARRAALLRICGTAVQHQRHGARADMPLRTSGSACSFANTSSLGARQKNMFV